MSLPVRFVDRHRFGLPFVLRIVSSSISCFDPRVSCESSWPRLDCWRHELSPSGVKNPPIIVMKRYNSVRRKSLAPCEPHRAIEEDDSTNLAPCSSIRRILHYSGESLNDLRWRLLVKAVSFRALFVWRRAESLMSAAMVLSIRRSSLRSPSILSFLNKLRRSLTGLSFLLASEEPLAFLPSLT
jgi:hypothetical protein